MANMRQGVREWTKDEVEAIVDDYFDMLDKEIRGEAYVKRGIGDRSAHFSIAVQTARLS